MPPDKLILNERPQGLKLILKVANSSTPEHSDSPLSQSTTFSVTADDSFQAGQVYLKKNKKKKKKKDRKHEKKKKHKEKRRKYDDDSIIICDDTPETPSAKKIPKKDEPPPQEAGREPRLCVQLLRQKQERNPLQRLLDHLHRLLEKKDPQQFFAWPVTDQIAPGYSKTITQPMDFSTMKQKIDDNDYETVDAYVEDFKLMCNNAMVYNRPETIYYRAAKRLLHNGIKILSPIKLCQIAGTIPGINTLSKDVLGFSLGPHQASSGDTGEDDSAHGADVDEKIDIDDCTPTKRKFSSLNHEKFESSEPDQMTSEQILEQAQKAAQATSEKLSLKRPKTSMGFLRQQNDGSTSLAVLIPGEGVDPERPRERSVTLGQLIGKLNHGTGQLQGFKEDRRNVAKTVKPLNYGAFGSYAPSYDSTFANISKEESDLLYETYGDESATAYAESILNFAKDCDYSLTMVDNLLDLLTGGEHRKTKSVIDDQRKFREEEERVKELMESKNNPLSPVSLPITNNHKTAVFPPKEELDQLRSLSDLGIDVSFIDAMEQSRETAIVQDKLDHTTALIEKLQQVQTDRLSAMPPAHLSQVLQPSETELHLAEKITESLTELAKQVPPGAIIPVPAIRKAMGIVPDTNPATNGTNGAAVVESQMDNGNEEESCVGVGQLDLESELREFLESDTALTSFPLQDDKTIEEMLCES